MTENHDSLALPSQTPALPDLSALAFGGTDLGEHMRRLENFGRRRSEREAAPLVLPDFEALAAEDSLDLGEDGEDLLEDARANIARGEYRLALEQLREFLEISPGHGEARYLRALCHYHLGEPLVALEITLPLREAEPQVRQWVRSLRDTVLDVLTPRETSLFLETRHADQRGADDRLRGFIAVAPEETEPPYFLALMLAMDGDYAAAFLVVRDAADRAEGDAGHLHALADTLASLAVRPLAKDAVKALQDGAYQRARTALRQLDRQWREMETLRDLDKFLLHLIGTKHSPSNPLPAPGLPHERRMRLYAVIADQYREEATDLVADQRWADAERVLAKVLHLVPKYPPPNFLYAVCLLQQGKEPERAITAAEIAATDPTLPDAKLLLQRARELREVIKINEAYEEHNAAVRRISRPPTRQELVVLRHAMDSLRQRMVKLQAIATTKASQKRVLDLKQAVTTQLREVDRALEILGSRDTPRSHLTSRPPLTSERFADVTGMADTRELARRMLENTTDPEMRKTLRRILDGLG